MALAGGLGQRQWISTKKRAARRIRFQGARSGRIDVSGYGFEPRDTQTLRGFASMNRFRFRLALRIPRFRSGRKTGQTTFRGPRSATSDDLVSFVPSPTVSSA